MSDDEHTATLDSWVEEIETMGPDMLTTWPLIRAALAANASPFPPGIFEIAKYVRVERARSRERERQRLDQLTLSRELRDYQALPAPDREANQRKWLGLVAQIAGKQLPTTTGNATAEPPPRLRFREEDNQHEVEH